MKVPGAPLRFLAGVLGLWISGRALMLGGERVETAAIASTPPTPVSAHQLAPQLRIAPWLKQMLNRESKEFSLTLALPASAAAEQERNFPSPSDTVQETLQLAALPPELLAPEAPTPSPRLSVEQAVSEASRLSGSAWLFARSKTGDRSLATSGQLGGSQAGVRLRWRMNPGEQLRTAFYGRISGPLEDTAGSEAALGAEWHPLPGKPLWIAAERRVGLGKRGRDAWSFYAAGGIWKPGLPMQLTLDGYAQAGIVGAHSRDLFADGSMRVTRSLSANGPRVGAGVWGAAQPGVARVDVGPHASIPLKIARQPLSLSADARLRVAGHAAPGSGVAVTLASDF
jgi:hypothetical protein